jgi:hypothetical protein
MIGSDLEDADLESRVASWAAGAVSHYTGNAAVKQPKRETVVGSQQLTATYDAAFETCALTLRSVSATSPSRRPSGSRGNEPGDDHDPRYRREAASASPAAARSGTHGSHRKIMQYMDQQMPEQQEGAAPASGGTASRMWAHSASACGRRARRGSALRRRLRARTGAVQVDVGVGGAVRVPALRAPTLRLHGLRQLTKRGSRGSSPGRRPAWPNEHVATRSRTFIPVEPGRPPAADPLHLACSWRVAVKGLPRR